MSMRDGLRVDWLNGWKGTKRAEHAHGTPTQSHIHHQVYLYAKRDW